MPDSRRDDRSEPKETGDPIDDAEERDPVRETVETIAELHRRYVSQVDVQQRTLERLTAQIGRPRFLFLTIAVVVVWIVVNVLLRQFGHEPFDVPPFFWLQSIICLVALLVAILVLITQNRQDRAAERRSQLDLQVSILVDQKVTTLIALVEELRRDMPDVRDRRDPLVEKLVQTSDITGVVEELNELLDEVEEEVVAASPLSAVMGSGVP